jgi:enoyl-CoA hydratase/carnithine racemase
VIELEIRPPLAWLTLNRPDALNALNQALTRALEEAVERVATVAEVRVLVVTGRGRAFCAGNDLREMAGLDPAEAETLAHRQAALLERFSRLPQVTLAAIDGYALGGGLMLALAQDLRIASDRARLGLPEVTFGFNPAYGIRRLVDVVGGGHARELLLTGRRVHAHEALRMGLVHRVVAAATLGAMAEAWAQEVARAPREGLAATKEILARLAAGGRPTEPEAYGAALRTSPAVRERLAAFLARRRPEAPPGGDAPELGDARG